MWIERTLDDQWIALELDPKSGCTFYDLKVPQEPLQLLLVDCFYRIPPPGFVLTLCPTTPANSLIVNRFI